MGCASSTNAASAPPSMSGDRSPFVDMLGDTLLSSSGPVPTSSKLSGKCVGLYFSAHWCPPCRGFTPVLSKAYASSLKAKGVEIIFVSSDQNESAFNSYYKEMPWLALPYRARSTKSSLSDKFGVQGIPTLVILGSDGSLITTDGRGRVMSDPTGKWVPAPKFPPTLPVAVPSAAAGKEDLRALLGDEPLLGTDGKTPIQVTEAVKDAPLVALYFSAHWCGPCRSFTPKLVTFVEMLEEEGIRLPVIFGSSDRDAAAFDEYFASMPWYAFPHSSPRIDALKTKYAVSGIPWLVVLDAAGNLVVNEADTMVSQGTPAYQKWLKLAKKEPAAAPAA